MPKLKSSSAALNGNDKLEPNLESTDIILSNEECYHLYRHVLSSNWLPREYYSILSPIVTKIGIAGSKFKTNE